MEPPRISRPCVLWSEAGCGQFSSALESGRRANYRRCYPTYIIQTGYRAVSDDFEIVVMCWSDNRVPMTDSSWTDAFNSVVRTERSTCIHCPDSENSVWRYCKGSLLPSAPHQNSAGWLGRALFLVPAFLAVVGPRLDWNSTQSSGTQGEQCGAMKGSRKRNKQRCWGCLALNIPIIHQGVVSGPTFLCLAGWPSSDCDWSVAVMLTARHREQGTEDGKKQRQWRVEQ